MSNYCIFALSMEGSTPYRLLSVGTCGRFDSDLALSLVAFVAGRQYGK